MDDVTFDAVARAVATGASRRQALRLIAAGALTAWLPARALAAPARQGSECEAGLTYCPGAMGSFVCVVGDCVCGDLIYCPPRSDGQPEGCYDLFSDYYHCGSCDMSCPSASPGPVACIGGECVATGCIEGLTDCTGNLDCTDLFADPFNCGACGAVCDSGVCEAGSCVQVGCAAGLTYCEEEPGFFPAGCYDLSSDLWHCGSCSGRCTTAGIEKACIDGQCVFLGCPDDQVDCREIGSPYFLCASLASDPNNCGACGNVCASGVCDAGSCSGECGSGLAYCPARTIGIGFDEQPYELAAGCYDLFSDRNHCGSCDNTCATTVGCYGGECGLPPCDEGLTACAAGCVDLDADPDNCGACSTACAAGQVCDGGLCGPAMTCAAGLTYCPEPSTSGAQPEGCYDLSSDYYRCGACDTSCPIASPGPMACIAGQCQKHCDPPRTLCTNPASIHPDYCADFSSDAENCGACGNVCPSGDCNDGVCAEVTTCAAGLTYCLAKSDPVSQPAGCYDLSSDYTHCGACDTSCPIASPGPMACIAGQCQKHCDSPQTLCTNPASIHPDYCADLSSDAQNCGTCTTACAVGEVCEAGTCTATTSAQDAASGATNRDNDSAAGGRTIQGAGANDPASVLVWPFDAKAGQWTIVHGYRAEDEDPNPAATPRPESPDFARLALEFAVCPAEDVDAAAGVCDLGAAGSDPNWDREATQGSTIVSPIDGTVAWTDGDASCQAVGIDITGHAGYRLALYNVEGKLKRGQRVTRGKRIGKVPTRGCERGDRLRMALYQPQQGASDDPVAAREGVPFSGEWAIAGCEYPDDKRTIEQYRGKLVPCKPEDEVSANS